MDKKRLQEILSQPFNSKNWLGLVKSVFGARQLLAQPKEIILPKNDKAETAYELGSFTTFDDRVIGLYKVNVSSDVWLERNKVGLRELLRKVYNYDVDGALIVFEQDEKWRLSFVSEIKVLNEEGEVIKQATEPKRYTYLLGVGEKVLTPSIQLSRLAGKSLSLEDIREAFSVEALNEEFYKIVAKQFYKLAGGTVGKGRKAKKYEPILKLPGLNPHENKRIYQEFAVRLIGRVVFCWFLKMKKSGEERALLPEDLLSSNAVRKHNNYYHYILEKIFFQILNTPIPDRLEVLPDGSEDIPFLNGGLFEPDLEDYYKANSATGLSEHLNTLKIEDHWFLEFFEELEKYNFTIDENSVTDVEVSIDPEMLGRIFENLLAEIDPDTEETARKATGSFYTPREIVDYMGTESLVKYLFNKTGIKETQLRTLFRMTDEDQIVFSNTDRVKILDALDKVKILDPACGSGAFPMGVLQKVVSALQKIDDKAKWWIEKRVSEIPDSTARNAAREKFENNPEYARKISIIQNSLYGVDIQPIAAEISKLRCFLTLIVDENIDETKENRGVEHLPNLEFKFVTADTLRSLPPEETNQHDMFGHYDELEKLKNLRIDYLQSHGEEKKRIKEQFLQTQLSISKVQNTFTGNELSRAYLISNWNPFSHEKVNWFDPEWMFGIESFDIVIGNPPYVSHDKIIGKKFLKGSYKVFQPFADLYCYFLEKGVNLLSDDGVLNFITSNSFLRTNYGKPLRNFLQDNTEICEVINVEDSQLFGNAVINTAILHFSKRKENRKAKIVNATYDLKSSFFSFVRKNSFYYEQNEFKKNDTWTLLRPELIALKEKIYNEWPTLERLGAKIRLGIATGSNKAFLINNEEALNLISVNENSIDLIKPVLRGRDIDRYSYDLPDLKILLTKNGVDVKKYPAVYNHLESFGEDFKNRGAKGQHWTNLRACAFFDDFKLDKIIWIELTDKGRFAICRDEVYLLNSAYFMIPPDNYSLEYLVAILNSKVIHFVLHSIAESSGTGTARWINNNVKEFPIPNTQNQEPFINIVSYVEVLSNLGIKANEHVPNSHLIDLFEEIIDALVMELYFWEEFQQAEIEFAKFVSRDFAPLDDRTNSTENIEIIHSSYQKLRERDNEIRNNLKLMDIKLTNIVGPIKASS